MSGEIPPSDLAQFDQSLAETNGAIDELCGHWRVAIESGLRLELALVGFTEQIQESVPPDVTAQLLAVAVYRLAEAPLGDT